MMEVKLPEHHAVIIKLLHRKQDMRTEWSSFEKIMRKRELKNKLMKREKEVTKQEGENTRGAKPKYIEGQE